MNLGIWQCVKAQRRDPTWPCLCVCGETSPTGLCQISSNLQDAASQLSVRYNKLAHSHLGRASRDQQDPPKSTSAVHVRLSPVRYVV